MLVLVDWMIIGGYLFISLILGIYLMRRGRKSPEEYFKSGSGTTWWLLGTSMVATTFAADTPLALSGMVVTSGIAQNWYWWCQVPVTIGVVFFFAALWKRANPLTDMEFVYLRYSGKSASFLRGFKALYLAIPYNCIIMGWVNMAMATVINLTIPNFPRIPFLDKFMLYIFMITPLSANVDGNIKEAYFRDQIDPLAIATRYELNTYDNIWTFKEYEAGIYKSNPPAFLSALRIPVTSTSPKLSEIEGVPAALCSPQSDQSDPTQENLLTRSPQQIASSLIRPVTLADGVTMEYKELENLSPKSLTIGQAILNKENRKLAATKPLMADVTVSKFLFDVHAIAAGVNQYKILLILFLLTAIYTSMSGLWGVLITDFFQFWLAMFGCIMLAIFAVQQCGGIDALFGRLVGIYGLDKARGMISMVPSAKASGLGLMSFGDFLAYILILWWAVGLTDGGMMGAQRMLSAKSERHASLGYLWFAIAHFAVRMWPWLMVGFAAAVMFPYTPYPNGSLAGTAVAEQGYIRVMLRILGPGWLGLLIATFLAAYMSTISTQINLGASYLMNDLYRPFIRKNADEKHYVKMGTCLSLFIAFVGIVMSLFLNNIKDAWFLLTSIMSGIGVVCILRWYWHRVNAWTEIASFAMPIFLTAVLRWYKNRYGFNISVPYDVLIIAPATFMFAMLITLLTKPVDRDKLIAFCKKVQPGGPGWKEIEDEIRKDDPTFTQRTLLTGRNFLNWGLGVMCVYCWLIGIGKILIGDVLYPNAAVPARIVGVALLLIGAVCGYIISRSFSTVKWSEG